MSIKNKQTAPQNKWEVKAAERCENANNQHIDSLLNVIGKRDSVDDSYSN